MELFGYEPDWEIVKHWALIAQIVDCVIGLIGGAIAILTVGRKKGPVESKTVKVNQGPVISDAKGQFIINSAKEVNIYYNGIPNAPDAVRNPYADGLRALREYRFKDAKAHFEETLTKTKDHSHRSAIHLALGTLLVDLGEYKASRVEFGKGLKLTEYAEDERARAWALNGLGLAEMHLGNYEAACNYYDEGKAIAEEIGYKEALAAIIGNYAVLLVKQGNLEGGLAESRAALNLHRQIGNLSGAANAIGNIGIILKREGDLEGALKSHRDALAIDRRIGNLLGEAQDLCNLGSVYLAKGKPGEGLKFSEEALKIAERMGAAEGLKIIKNNIKRAKAMLKEKGR